ncbi:helix-turn-helix domain-containing protein [Azospirillum aestuarii]|uniref:helix-turn-helix domain-containing protein n=1 Tax=Azospirillum aestuarii TaxID=2802052 RepID=UPI004054D02A
MNVDEFRLPWQVRPMLTPAQSRAARGLLNWTQDRLAAEAHVGNSTVRDFEKGRRVPSHGNLLAIKQALETGDENGSVIFIPENGEGPGVRMRKQVSDDGVSETIEGLESE